MSHITEVKIGITPADVNSGILSKAINNVIPGATVVNEKTTLNRNRGAGWEKQEVDAYVSEPGKDEMIGFKIDSSGNYKLVGDFYNHYNFQSEFEKEFLEQKVLTNAEENNMTLSTKYVNPNNANETVYEFESSSY